MVIFAKAAGCLTKVAGCLGLSTSCSGVLLLRGDGSMTCVEVLVVYLTSFPSLPGDLRLGGDFLFLGGSIDGFSGSFY